MVDPEGHTPPVQEGRSHLGESYRACQRARPRSAVTVSLSTPALARLTRSVRVEGRVVSIIKVVAPGHRQYHFGRVWPILGFTDVALCMSDIPDAPGTSSSRVLSRWKDPAHFVPEDHSPHRGRGRHWSLGWVVGHEV